MTKKMEALAKEAVKPCDPESINGLDQDCIANFDPDLPLDDQRSVIR